MTSREFVQLGLVGLLTALLIAFLGSTIFGNTPHTTNLMRSSSADPFVYVDIAFGSQSFKVLVDTGSSDTWLVTTDFTCLINNKKHPQADCKLGPLYEIDDSFTEIPGEILHAGYEPMVASGFPGTTQVTLAGVKVTAEVGVVNRIVSLQSKSTIISVWSSTELDQSDPSLDSFASGLIGLAFSPVTNVYTANSTQQNHTNIPEKSIMTTIFSNTKLPQKFTLALSRGETNPTDGGTFTIGGLPNLADSRINATNDLASADLEAAVDQNKQHVSVGTPKIAWYAITVGGLYYGTLGNVTVNTTPKQFILDSGNPSITLPEADVQRWISMFDPPMPYNNKTLQVNCNASVPNLEFRIGHKLFPMNPIDLINRNSNGQCSSKVQPVAKAPYFLGDPFHRNVVAVYDWENEQMQFASRPYYMS